MSPTRSLALALLLGSAAGTAAAQTRTIGVFGAWEAFGGATTDGRPVCGVSSSFPDGRYFGIKYWRGQDRFTVQLIKPSWQIPAGTRVPLAVQFDQQAPWTATASGFPATTTAGAFIEFTVPFARLENFLREFRLANTASVNFQSGNEPAWRLTLSGSNAASQALDECVRRMGGGVATSAKPGLGGPTQPFGGGPSQPFPAPPQVPVGGGKF
jgi:hypothetical protein